MDPSRSVPSPMMGPSRVAHLDLGIGGWGQGAEVERNHVGSP